MFFTLLIGAACLAILRICYKDHVAESHQKLKNFDKFQFTDLPLIGHVYRYMLLTDYQLFNQIFRDLKYVTKSTIIWMFGKPLVVLTNPEDIHIFLSSPISSQKGITIKGLFGRQTALLTAHMQIWKPLRRSMNPIFSNSSMKTFISNINRAVETLICDLDEYCDRGDFKISTLIGRCGTISAARTYLKRDLTQMDVATECYERVQALLERNGHRALRFYIYADIMNLRKIFKTDRPEIQMYEYFVDKLDLKVQEDLKTGMNNDEEENDTNYFYKRIIHLVNIGLLREDDIPEHMGFFLTAASNTASSAVSSAILLLAMHPEIQETLYNELQSTLDSNFVHYESINKIAYLDQVVKEVLRVLPPVPLIQRKTYNADIALGDRIIPENTDVLISILNLHRNAAYWGNDADKFNPDNFLPEKISERSRYSYIPFAIGERHCIANKFSIIQIKVMIVPLIMKYRFTTKTKMDDIQLAFEVTLKVVNGANVSITRRDVKE